MTTLNDACFALFQECKYPLVAFDLVRKLAAVWYSGSSENSPGNMHIALCDSLPENHNFPSIFASFLAASSMTPYIRPIVGILYTLLDSAEENSNMVEWQEIRATVSVAANSLVLIYVHFCVQGHSDEKAMLVIRLCLPVSLTT